VSKSWRHVKVHKRRKPRKCRKSRKCKKATNLVPRSKLRTMQKRLIHAERVLRSIAELRCRSKHRLHRKLTDPRKRRDICICPSCSAKSYFKATMADEPYKSTNVRLQNWEDAMSVKIDDGSEPLWPIKKGEWFTFFANSRQPNIARNHLAASVSGPIVEGRCGRKFDRPWKLVENKKSKKKGKVLKERLYPDCQICMKSELFDQRVK